MNAVPYLATLMHAIRQERLEVVLIGNAAAAIHGAPVTTLDFDFMFRQTPVNMAKLKRVAASLDAMILRPFYPVSKLYRMVNDSTGLQADFMPVIHGVRSFASLKSRAEERDVGGVSLLIASLEQPSARSPRRGTRRCPSAKKSTTSRSNAPRKAVGKRQQALAALAAESDRQLDELIRRRLAMPIEQRMNFLRRRLPGGGSCL